MQMSRRCHHRLKAATDRRTCIQIFSTADGRQRGSAAGKVKWCHFNTFQAAYRPVFSSCRASRGRYCRIRGRACVPLPSENKRDRCHTLLQRQHMTQCCRCWLIARRSATWDGKTRHSQTHCYVITGLQAWQQNYVECVYKKCIMLCIHYSPFINVFATANVCCTVLIHWFSVEN